MSEKTRPYLLLIAQHSSLITSKGGGGATRTHRGLDARLLSTQLHCLLCGASVEEEGAGVEPAEAFKLRQFSGLLGLPVPNLPSMHQEGLEPPRSRRATALQAACQTDSASDAKC